MEVIFILIVICLIAAVGFLIAFIWAVNSGQFDDDYTPSVRILFDDKKDDLIEENKVENK
jgi:cbb3-type cytochrome oxidase maturation protein